MSGNIVVSIFTYVLAVAIGFFVSYLINKLKISKANVSAAKIIDDATAKADTLVKEAILDAKTEVYELKLQAEKEAKEQREEINEYENKLLQREKTIDRRDIAIQGKEDVLAQRVVQLDEREARLGKLEDQLKEKIDAKVVELEKIAAAYGIGNIVIIESYRREIQSEKHVSARFIRCLVCIFEKFP